MQRWRPESELDGINSGSWYHCWVIGNNISLVMRGRLDSSCLQSSMLHGSEIWPVRKENEVVIQWAEMRVVRWMRNVNVKDRVPSKELRERLGIDDIILILQQNRLRWYGHVLQKEDTDWGPAHVVQWSNHLGAICSRAWRSQWPRIDSSLGPGASAY